MEASPNSSNAMPPTNARATSGAHRFVGAALGVGQRREPNAARSSDANSSGSSQVPPLVLIGDASEASEALGVKDDLDALARLLPQSREHLLARLPEDLDPDRHVERLCIGCSSSLGDNRNVRLHRGGVGVNLDNRDLVAGFADVLVERDQAWLIGLDEFDETRHARSLAVKSPRLETIRCDEDQRSLRSDSLPRTSPGNHTRHPVAR